MSTLSPLLDRLSRFVWEDAPPRAPWWYRALQRAARIVLVVSRDYWAGTLNLHAMSLVYTTLLALIPALAIVFSVLKGFGVDRELEVFLADFLAPLGAQGVEIRRRILEFVEQVNIGVLGSVGFAVLIYTGVSLLQKVEAAFNEIWQVQRQRPLARRFSDFVSVLLAGPVLLVTAMGLMASVAGTAAADTAGDGAMGALVREMSRLTPYVLVTVVFTLLYMLVPNTKVRLGPALTGAIVASIAWNVAGWAFASFVVTSARYALIYSAFASLVVFMFWMYVGWLIVLVGASIAFYQQNPAYLTREPVFRLSIAAREKLALTIAVLVARAFERGDAPWTAQRIARAVHLPLPPVERVVMFLLDAGLLVEAATEPPGLLPARPLDRISVDEFLNVVRNGAEGRATLDVRAHRLPGDQIEIVDRLMARLDAARREALDGLTLRDLARGDSRAAVTAMGKNAGAGQR